MQRLVLVFAALISAASQLLVDANHLLLFDLSADPGERTDLAARRPDLVARLKKLLADWEADIDRIRGRG